MELEVAFIRHLGSLSIGDPCHGGIPAKTPEVALPLLCLCCLNELDKHGIAIPFR